MTMPWVFRRIVRDWPIVAVVVLVIAGVAYYLFWRTAPGPASLRFSAGSAQGQRYAMGRTLQAEAATHQVWLDLVTTKGSEDALDQLEAGDIQVALIQGGLSPGRGGAVRQVAALHVEPLHLLVRQGIHAEVSLSLDALRGRSVNLGEVGSGTRSLAVAVLRFAGLEPGADYRAGDLGYDRLEAEADASRLPDAVFMVSLLPSPVAKHLIARHGYRQVALPFAEAFALAAPPAQPEGRGPVRHDLVLDAVVPAYTYGVCPAEPAEPFPTLGLRMLLVAREDVDREAVARLLDCVFATPFTQLAHPPLTASLLNLPPEFPVHPGTRLYQERSKPLLVEDVIEAVDKELSITGALLGAAFFLWQWIKRRYRRIRESGFEHYILRVARVEENALRLELAETLDLAGLLALQDELGRIKADAIARFAGRELEGEDLLSGFLAQASDARDHLTRLILHRRDDLERRARKQKRDAAQLWREALGGEEGGAPSGPEGGTEQAPPPGRPDAPG